MPHSRHSRSTIDTQKPCSSGRRPAADRTYLLLVENERVNGRVVQRVRHRLGRLDQLRASGQLDTLLKSLGRFSDDGERPGGEALATLAGRRFDFSVERAIFLTVVHRWLAPGSDRAAERWRHDYAMAGTDGLELHHLYRAMAWLGKPLPASQQAGATPFAPRTTKDLVEEALFARRRDLFSRLDLVFFDTTSLYFHGAGGDTLGRHGHSRDHRPDLKQMVVGLVLDGEGHPVCTELWPGNTTDVTTLVPIVDRLKQTF
jgi:hypothetical protein